MSEQVPTHSVDDVIITGELLRRPSRPPDHGREAAALSHLARELAEQPGNVLQTLADLIVDMGIAESAGISLREGDRFRCDAVSGAWAPHKGEGMPFDASPCGMVVGRNEMLLFASPERMFAGARMEPLIKEALLVPFHADGVPVGTLWILSHEARRRFDREDARLLQSLSGFASAAYQMGRALDGARAAAAVSEGQLADELNAMRRLYQLSKQLVLARDLEVVLDEVLAAMMDLHESDFGNIQLYDPRTGALRMVAHRGFQPAFLKHFEVIDATTGTACGKALTARERVMVHDVERERAPGASLDAARQAGYRSVQSTPLFTATGAPLGMISTHWREPHVLSERVGRLSDLYARHGADAIAAHVHDAEFRATEERAHARQGVLLAELQHRVRNILAIIRSVISRTSANKTDVRDFVEHLQARIDAMARTQAVLTRSVGAGVELGEIVRDELLAQSAGDEKFVIAGPPVVLSPKAAEVLTLAIHELATNAVKYGALAQPEGVIRAEWSTEQRDGRLWVSFAWRETGVCVEGPGRSGFGTELITRRVPYQLGGDSELCFTADGLVATIAFPMTDAPSVLQTDAGRAREPSGC
jgi:two-component sensor histidine kinase/putative methionine-R-sulfoxide reductase with GAF domain